MIKPEDFNGPALWRMVKEQLGAEGATGYSCSLADAIMALELAGLREGLVDSAVELIMDSGVVETDEDLNFREVEKPAIRPEDDPNSEEYIPDVNWFGMSPWAEEAPL